MIEPTSSAPAAVFFDLGNALGSATVDPSGHRPPAFDVFPYIPALLTQLRASGLRLGLLSRAEAEPPAAIQGLLDPAGRLAGVDKELVFARGRLAVTEALPNMFERAATEAGLAPTRCMFVGDNSADRRAAMTARWRVCPHPLLVEEVLQGHALCYVRLTFPAHGHATKVALRGRAVVPQYRVGAIVYALTSETVARALRNDGITCELLGDVGLPDAADLFLLRHEGPSSGIQLPQPPLVLFSSEQPEGIVVAIGPDEALGIDAVHLANAAHGHTLKLTPDPLLLDEPSVSKLLSAALLSAALPADALEAIQRIDAANMLLAVERYAGIRPLDGSTNGHSVRTRHTLNDEENTRAVAQLVADLRGIGGRALTVQLHPFDYLRRERHNVEAELGGGSGELVLVTAHLDSTARNDGSDGGHRRAPGADDDASGMAAVLAVAACLVEIFASRPPTRTVRFVFFNAEEQGLVGSACYARRSKARGEAIAAVFQMDMIGFNARPPMTWEIHVGAEGGGAVETASRGLAELLASVAGTVARELAAPEIFDGASAEAGDPAAGRTDHSSFHAQGYPACAVTEDLFAKQAADSEPDANPNYHREADTTVDPAYIVAIAKVVAAAAWRAAR